MKLRCWVKYFDIIPVQLIKADRYGAVEFVCRAFVCTAWKARCHNKSQALFRCHYTVQREKDWIECENHPWGWLI